MDIGRSEIRPELQALRALAVVLVVVFHLWPWVLPGGYVGVDVFFVLSGFLITSHLAREVVRTGSVSLTQFWARRIRRLLPAAFTVLLVSFAATVIWLPRSIWEQTYQEIGAAALYVLNWLLAANAVDYLAADNTPTIVQHFWSLAVEEQFYIVWPALILVAVAAARRTAGRWRPEGRDPAQASLAAAAIALGIVAIASFAYSIFETSRSQPSAYFITPTRAWEFAAGGLLGLVPVGVGQRVSPRLALGIRGAASWLGLGAIITSAWIFTADSPFPGYIALLPVMGAVLFIWAGDVRHAWAPTAVAGFGPVQLIGDLSYSIYLWHWPLIILYPVLRGSPPSLGGGLLIFGLSVALAWATKVFVEDPVRRRTFWTSSRRRSYALAGTLMAVTLVIVATANLRLQQDRSAELASIESGLSGQLACFGANALAIGADCPEPFAVTSTVDPAGARLDQGLVFHMKGCLGAKESTRLNRCVVGDPGGDVGGAIVGNSHAAVLASGLDRYAREHAWRLDTYAHQSCLGVILEQVSGYPSMACVDWTNQVIDAIVEDPDTDVVVFQSYVGAVPRSFPKAARAPYKAAMAKVWSRLLAAGKQVVVVGDPPGMRPDLAPDCVGMHLDAYDPCSRPVASVSLDNIMMQAARATPGVKPIDIGRYFCDTKRCHALIGGVIVYSDAHHLTETYATTLARLIGPEINPASAGE